MMFVTKKALRRRTFLRGVGATVSLPLLDAMIPALSAKPLNRQRRHQPPRQRTATLGCTLCARRS